jgi:hypothetical protein
MSRTASRFLDAGSAPRLNIGSGSPNTRLSSRTSPWGHDLVKRSLLDREDLIVGDRAVEHRKRALVGFQHLTVHR